MGKYGLDLVRDKDVFYKTCNQAGLAGTLVAAKTDAYFTVVSFISWSDEFMNGLSALPVAIASHNFFTIEGRSAFLPQKHMRYLVA